MRSTTTRPALAAATAAAAVAVTLATPAAATGGDARPDDAVDVVDVELTDGALYLGTYDDGAHASVWARAFHSVDGSVLLGSGELVASAYYADLAASDDAVAFKDAATHRVAVRGDDRSFVVDDEASGVPESFSGTWAAVGTWVYRIPAADGPGFTLTNRNAAARSVPPWGAEASSSWLGHARVSDTAVVWAEDWEATSDAVDGRGTALYAQPLDATGPTGDVVLLEEAYVGGGSTDEELVTALEVTDTAVVWTVLTEEGAALRWVPVADLGAEPQERALTVVPYVLTVDGEHAAVAGEPAVAFPEDVAAVVAEPTAATGVESFEVAVVPLDAAAEPVLELTYADAWLADVDLHGGLLAVATHSWTGDDVVEVLTLDGEVVPALPGFADVDPGNPRVPDIDWLVLEEVTTGYADGTFRPYAPVTRQAMAAFLYRVAGSPAWTAPERSPFADVAPGSPFYAEITWLHDQGITEGSAQPDGSVLFRPAAAVSRQAMAAFLHRYAEGDGTTENTLPAGPSFADVGPDQAFADDIAWLAAEGISTGTDLGGGTVVFRPADAVSRQAMAAFLQRLDRVMTRVE